MAKANHIAGIDCEGAAGDAIGLILIGRFEEMCALRERAMDWNDPEGVHDMRVSSRRLRGALRDFMPYLKKRKLSAVMKEISSLADALGAVRDQDVAIMGLQKLAASAPVEAAAVVEQLRRAREIARKQARRELKQMLRKEELTQLQRNFVKAVKGSAKSSKPRKRRSKHSQSGQELTYREVARRIIVERLNELEKLGDGLYQPLQVEPLHCMRIAAKRLRYALELFEPCWGSEFPIVAREIAALQSSLGELHDSDIWIATFGAQLNGVKKQQKDRAAAALWLLSHFVKSHSRHLRGTLDRWRNWQANDFGLRLRECLQKDSNGVGPVTRTAR